MTFLHKASQFDVRPEPMPEARTSKSSNACVYYSIAAFADGHTNGATTSASVRPRSPARPLPTRYSWILKNLKAWPLTAIKSRSRPPRARRPPPPPTPQGKGFRPRNKSGPQSVGRSVGRFVFVPRQLGSFSSKLWTLAAAATRTLSDNRYMSAS